MNSLIKFGRPRCRRRRRCRQRRRRRRRRRCRCRRRRRRCRCCHRRLGLFCLILSPSSKSKNFQPFSGLKLLQLICTFNPFATFHIFSQTFIVCHVFERGTPL